MYRTLLVALDGSEPSVRAGEIALRAAASARGKIIACHVYGANLHMRRFMEMEPGLPSEFRHPHKLDHLRQSHGSLIRDGFASLSCGYMDSFLEQVRQAGVAVESAVVEGRNYVRILELADEHDADLIALGASGLGDTGDGQLGSVAARVIRGAKCDVLVARATPIGKAVLACVDGSEHSYAATATGAWWARMLSAPLAAAAAYDPAFHAEVFQAMAKSLSEQRRKEVGLDDQQDLHDRLIDKGLATLYQGFLDSAAARTGNGDVTEKLLLEGKAYRAVNDCAARLTADLVVLGRFGHHYEPSSQIGSNAEAVARLGACNVLLTAPATGGRA